MDEVVKGNCRVSSAALSEIQEAASQLNGKVAAIEQSLQHVNEQIGEFKTWWRCSTDEYEEKPAYVNINSETKSLLFRSQFEVKQPKKHSDVNEMVLRDVESRPASADDLERFRAEVHEKLCFW